MKITSSKRTFNFISKIISHGKPHPIANMVFKLPACVLLQGWMCQTSNSSHWISLCFCQPEQKAASPDFQLAALFTACFPILFPAIQWAVSHPYLEISYVHIPQIYTHLTLKTPAALHSQGLQVQMWFRRGWRCFTGQNPGDNYHWLLKDQDLPRLVVLTENAQEWELQPVSWQIFSSGNYVLPF